MTTSYPVTLLPVSDLTGWNPVILDRGRIEDSDGGAPENWVLWQIDAPDGPTAELRMYSYMAKNYQDDLRGSTMTATAEDKPGRWTVRYSNYYD